MLSAHSSGGHYPLSTSAVRSTWVVMCVAEEMAEDLFNESGNKKRSAYLEREEWMKDWQ